MIAILSRKDQQQIATQYELEYGKLIMMRNKQGDTDNASICAQNLFKEVRKIANTKTYLFDEDVADILQNISSSIQDNFLVKKNPKILGLYNRL